MTTHLSTLDGIVIHSREKPLPPVRSSELRRQAFPPTMPRSLRVLARLSIREELARQRRTTTKED